MDYDYNNWNHELIQDPNILIKKLKSYDIKGRTIKNIKIPYVFDLLDGMEEYIYRQTESQEQSDLKNFKDNYEFHRHIQVDNPIIIEFDDDSTLEIDYSEGSTILVGRNSLPKDVEFSDSNLDGNVMFSNIIGQKVLGYAVEMEDEPELDWDFTGSYGVELNYEAESYVSRLRLILSQGQSLVFESWIDYGEVYSEEYKNISLIKWGELKKGINEQFIRDYIS